MITILTILAVIFSALLFSATVMFYSDKYRYSWWRKPETCILEREGCRFGRNWNKFKEDLP
jgi:hypothetical protein